MKDEYQNIQKEVSELRAQARTAKAETKKVQSSKDVKERSKREKQKSLESVQKVLAETKSRYYNVFILVNPTSRHKAFVSHGCLAPMILNLGYLEPVVPKS